MAQSKKKSGKSEYVKDKLREKKKLSKQILKEKRARLVVKNLPFKVTEENLKEYFEKFGEVANVQLLKKPDGKLVGCGFVQFKLVQKAAKAQFHTNKKPFLGRDIIVDFAKPKSKYEKQKKDQTKSKTEGEALDNKSGDVIEIKDEPLSKIEAVNKEEPDDVYEDINVSDLDSEENSEKDDGDVKELDKPEENRCIVSNDISEGKTIFIKNIPFNATNEDLKECMLQFGRVYYALICMDKLTEHSKGTAFVKFLNKEDAEKTLKAGTELKLLGNILDCHPALERNSLQNKLLKDKDDKKKPKDSRNLYLVKEGVILAGTKAAENVSATDMAKRLQLEQYKTQMLRNLNMFVSRDRLIVHNLPHTWDDKKLRTLLQKYGGTGAVIKEARIMRDMRKVNSEGVGTSKEYGFVTFSTHEHALTALRALNNNPDIFSASKRPIVAFSIENKAMLKAKLRRLEKSKIWNPKAREYDSKSSSQERLKNETGMTEKLKQYGSKLPLKRRQLKIKDGVTRKVTTEGRNDSKESIAENKYTGVHAKPGAQLKMRSRYKLKVQAKLHRETLKKEKKKQKTAKKSLNEKKREFTKQDKQRVAKKRSNDDGFSKMVSDYKKRLSDGVVTKKAKWYS